MYSNILKVIFDAIKKFVTKHDEYKYQIISKRILFHIL